MSGTDAPGRDDVHGKKNTEKLILALCGGVIIAALASIAVFSVRLKKKK